MPGGLATGQLLDERYALEERLGEDTLGTTWRAHDRGLGRTVCLRDLRWPDDLFAEEPARLKQALMAARLAIRLDHPGSIHVYDAFLDGDRLILVTEWTATRSLAALVARKGPLAPKRAAAIGLDLLDPLAAAHARNLVHGFLTPDTVLVPDKGIAQMSGLGMAPSFLDQASQAWMDAMAIAACLAPEQIELRGSSPSSDLWALGATLYFAVEGTHAFESQDAVVDGPPRPAVHAKVLGPILERLLSKEPAWRPPMDELRHDLAEVAGVVLPGSEPEPPAAAPEEGRRRGRRDRLRANEEEPPAEPNWDAAVAGDGPSWTDGPPGSAADTSDVWMPEFEDEADGEDSAEPAEPWGEPDSGGSRMAAPDLTTDVDEAEDDPFAPGSWDEAASDDVIEFEAPGLAGPPVSTEETAAAEPFAAAAPADAPLEPAAAATPPGGEVTATADSASPEAEAEAEAEEDESHRFRSAPSWPPPVRRRSIGVIVLCSVVMIVMIALLITNGRLGRPRQASTQQANNRPVLGTDPALVPADWIAYRHPNIDLTISYPPKWTLREEGSLLTFREPATGTELRVDYKKPKGPDPEQVWLTQERDFLGKHPTDYKRLQLSPASYLGHVAALWEYTYLDGNLPVHAVDLGFLTDDYGFTLSFRAPAGTWDTMLPVFHGYLSSVKPPE